MTHRALAGPLLLGLLALAACGEKDGGDSVDDSGATDFCGGASASIALPDGDLSGEIELSVTLAHPEGQEANLTLSYAVGDGAFSELTLLSGEVTGLASAADGEVHSFTWDSVADLGMVNVDDVTLSAQAVSACGPWTRSELPDVSVVNEEVIPPICTAAVDTPSGIGEGTFPFSFTLSHPEGVLADVEAEFSVDGGASFLALTHAFEDCDGDEVADSVQSLATSAEGVAHCLTWISGRDITSDKDDVVIRVTCSVGGEEQSVADSEAFSVHNDPTPDPGELIITELMVSPSARNGEYIEVFNASGHELNLHGLELGFWYAGDDTRADPPVGSHRIQVGSTVLGIDPGEHLVLASNSQESQNGCLDVAYEWGNDIALESDAILAIDSGSTRVAELSFADADGWSMPRRAALSLDPDAHNASDWTDPSSWCEASSAIEACEAYPDQSDLGTPGLANDDCP
ncbi:MAG: lamin tail domain-containing protein [Alphaproteobacteria bacterium]|nr:lamin tail domain-containing protein [Alphaproteobacteria bacterium]